MTKETHDLDTGRQADATTSREQIVSEIARMISEWERSDELASEFAERLASYFLSKKDTTSDANCIA